MKQTVISHFLLHKFTSLCLATMIALLASCQSRSQTITYVKEEVMIPMRDGVKLFTRIYIPQNVKEPVPILLMRSPYSSWNMGTVPPDEDPYVRDMAKEGYIFVYQNIRGKQRSEGKFVMQRPVIANRVADTVDESTDTYDTIEWLLKHVKNNNGKVGQLGISYPGWLALVSSGYPHPALKAVSPQAEMGDLFLGDDFHHNGAFRLSYGFEYSFEEEAAKGDTSFPFPQYDLYDWYLRLGPLSNVNEQYFHHRIPTWDAFVQHPDYDSFWQHQSPLSYIDTPRIPTLHVGGFWDQEDINGPQLMYSHMEKYDVHHDNFICLGPWYHGQWVNEDVEQIGNYHMGSNTAAYFQQQIQKAWFDYWLKGKGNGHFPEAIVFQTGSNQWKTYDTWPPRNAIHRQLFIQANGQLSFHKPQTQDSLAFDAYISDPRHPVPYRSRPIEKTYSPHSRWRTWLTEDQRFVDHRPDVATWETPPLDSNLTVTGDIVAHLFASTTGTDADWVVKLIDVYPDLDSLHPTMSGYELMVASEVFRGRFRKSFTQPEPIQPGKVEAYVVDLHQINHVFRKGHRLMVQIQSTWFPVIDRNPQRYVPNIFEAKENDFQTATQRIYRNARYATYVDLPVMKE
ncbi:CocE/NonD family hydrolase [Thermoflavifilum thermophilum]|nr:CocE/NonD family hydrolase [Thermoflavifilum thermophilum]